MAVRLPTLVTAATLVASLMLAGAVPAQAATPFRSSVVPIPVDFQKKMTSWRPGCPVHVRDLRLVRVTYADFAGTARQGKLIVHRDSARRMVRAMRALYATGFRVQRMQLPERYGSDDQRMMRANLTSAFNCRFVSGTRRWSQHAYGRAIDVNPVQNPWVDGEHVSPAAGRRYVDRSRPRRGMIRAGDATVRAFAGVGWRWGGYWTGARDYMHFSATGR